jgi:hypothetical protein
MGLLLPLVRDRNDSKFAFTRHRRAMLVEPTNIKNLSAIGAEREMIEK